MSDKQLIKQAASSEVPRAVALGLAVLCTSALHSARVEAQETPVVCLMTVAQTFGGGVPLGPYATLDGSQTIDSCTTADGRAGAPACGEPPGPEGTVYTYPGSCSPGEPLRTQGFVSPKYIILGVLYAPPGSGSQDCKYNSSVVYDTDSAIGTTLSASHTVKDANKVSVSAGASASMVVDVEAGVSVAMDQSMTNSDEMTIKTNLSSMTSVFGPCYDGIDHDRDQIMVLFDPVVPVEISEPAGCQNCGQDTDRMTWQLSPTGGITAVFTAGELKGTTAWRPSTQASITAHALTQNDVDQILAADPLAWWTPDTTDDPDTGRFVRAFGLGTFPYIAAQDGPPTGNTRTMKDTVSTANAMARSFDTTVALNTSFEVGFLEFFKTKLASEASWTWTNSNASALSDSSSIGATVTIGSPSASYVGPSSIAVYYDTMYKTYAFVGKI